MTRGMLCALGCGIGLLAGFGLGHAIGKTVHPPTLPEQWVEVYDACVDRLVMEYRTECIAAADRVVACEIQKGGKHE